MAIIKIDDEYQIYIDANNVHEARVDLHKSYLNKKNGIETKQYRSIGYFSNIESACESIYKDMNIKKANEDDSITLLEWIEIVKSNKKYIENIIKNVLT